MILKFIKYNIVQLAAYGIELVVFFSCLFVFPNSLVGSNIAAKSSAGLFAFFAHKHFTFQKKGNKEIRKEALRYILVLLANTAFGSLLLVLLADVIPSSVAKPISDVITVGLTFILTHNIVFKYDNESKDRPT